MIKFIFMKWLNKNIVIISFAWWLIQGVLLLLNEIRVYFKNSNHFTLSIFVIGIGLIIISFLLFIRNKQVRLSLGIILFLYSIVSLVTTMMLLLWWGRHLTLWLFLLVPIINIILSIKLVALKRQ